MKTIEGFDVKIFTDNVEETALNQIRELLSIDVFSDKKIRIMPDVHPHDVGDHLVAEIAGESDHAPSPGMDIGHDADLLV